MPDKYVSINAQGRRQEVEAVANSAGVADAGKIVALDANGQLAQAMMPTGVGPDTKTGTAAETIAAGDFVYFDGTGQVRRADATTAGKEAQGFCLSGFTASQTALVYFEGVNTQLTGLTIGTRYFLSAATPGKVTATAPTTSGNVLQFLGTAIATTQISFEPDVGVIRA